MKNNYMFFFQLRKEYMFIVFLFLILSTGILNAQKIYWGSSAAPFPGETGVNRVQAWERLNDIIKSLNGGYGLHARRTYDANLPVNWSASSMAADAGLCPVSVSSFKASWEQTANGSNYNQIIEFVKSIPDDRIVYLCFFHEPEDDISTHGSSDLFTSAFARFAEAVIEAEKPNVYPSFVYMAWTFNPASGRDPNDWNIAQKLKPEHLDKVVAGMDGYSSNPSSRTAGAIFENPRNIMKSWGFSRFGIFETATKRVEQSPGRAEWICDLAKWVYNMDDIELVCWFHSNVGSSAGEDGWYLGQWIDENNTFSFVDSDGSLSAYSELVRLEDTGIMPEGCHIPLHTRQTVHQYHTKLYSSPFSDILTIEAEGEFTWSIFHVNGKFLGSGEGKGIMDINPPLLNNGIYIIRIQTNNNVITHKVLRK